jgi:predicted ATP-grasp superfamily ATP-dependent carboligase
VIAGVSTRAAASSAVRAGFDVTSIDAFADLDQPAAARVVRVPRFTAAAAARAACRIDGDAVVYLSSFENHPHSVAALARGRALWGNAPGVLARVRDPYELTRAMRRRGIACATVDAVAGTHGRWLVKPLASGGGHGVRRVRPGARAPAHACCQEFIDGMPASLAFVAAHGHAVPLGFSRQLIGDAAFGSSRFRYCGSILGPASEPIAGGLPEVAAAIAEEFGLVGLNGVDVIVRNGAPVVIEVNPRWSSSMELIERAHGEPLLAGHAAACEAGELPRAALAPPPAAYGKAVVFARADVMVPDTTSWLADPDIADVPRAGERVGRGRPLCTVFAMAATTAACYAALVQRAANVYAALDRRAEVLA